MSIRRGRTRGGGVLVTLALAVGASSWAWACVPQARLVALQPRSSGAPGSEVVVEGVGFDPGPVEIRWNEIDGAMLAEADGPNFSTTVTIPQTTLGLYAVLVISRLPDGGVGNAGRAAFEVTNGQASGGDGVRPVEGRAPPTASEDTEAAGSASSSRTITMPALVITVVAFALGVAAGVVVARSRRRPRTSLPAEGT